VESATKTASEVFWRRLLSGVRDATPAPSVTSVSGHAGESAGEVVRSLTPGLTRALCGVARRRQVSVNALVSAAWSVVLAHRSGRSDVVFGASLTHRPNDIPGIETMVGPRVNNLPIRVRVDANEQIAHDLGIRTFTVKEVIAAAFSTDGRFIAITRYPAEGKKVTDQKEFKGRLAFIRNKLLMETLLQQEGKAALTPDAMKKVYDEAVKQMGNEQEVRARHILVPTEDEAKAVLAEVKKGTDFAELARQKSNDPGAAAEGGDLGYFGKEQMVPEFAEVAFKLDKGQVSDPVKTQFGWHIIKVEDKRTKPVPEFDKVKDQIETYVTRKAQADYIHKLQETAKIERLDRKK
jgi:peptidyl-prolyl cis-trans isomerase C